jgi:antitoxin (DNA-binding transcriptional repressor) of toxin-antitoxin stability system
VQHRLNIHEAKTHLSRHLSNLKEGDLIIICKRNQPIAEIRPIPQKAAKNRPVGLGKGTVEIGDAFFQPLPDDLLNLFEGSE